MSAPQESPTTIHQAPRQFPYLPDDTITIYPLASPTSPQFVSLLVSGMGLIALVVSILIYARASPGNSTLILGFVAISGITMLGSIITFFVQLGASRRDASKLLALYEADLKKKAVDLAARDAAECAVRDALQSPIAAVTDATQIWQRQPTDEDFLLTRIGVGPGVPHYTVTLGDTADRVALPPKDKRFVNAKEDAQALVNRYRELQRPVPVAVSLLDHPVIAVCGADAQGTATGIVREIAAHVALNHSPLDTHLMVIGPERQIAAWNWLFGLVALQRNPIPQFGFGPDARDSLCEALLETLMKRETALGDKTAANTIGQGRRQPTTLPHLIVIVDAFSAQDKQNEADTRTRKLKETLGPSAPTYTWRSPLAEPALALALRKGRELGVTVIAVHASRSAAPAQTSLIIDSQRRSLRPILPPHARNIEGITFDQSDQEQFRAINTLLFGRLPESDDALTLVSDVQLLSLFTPPISDPTTYDVQRMWQVGAQHSRATSGEKESFTVPLGEKLGGKPVLLDLAGDGPHGLLIGQTGSGKSELLQSLIMALAVQYSPDQVNFVLVDYKGGLSLETCAKLPHTIAFLTNLAQASQSGRFLTFLEAEMLDRQRKQEAKIPFPRLFVVIDEFAELVTRRQENDQTDTIVENLLRVLRLGRQLKVHLLFAAQRPEGGIIQRLRGYVQYRICLRVNADEDSRDVLGRPDAATLPADTPGRGYLLRGDKALTLFQSARVTVPFVKDNQPSRKQGEPTDLILLDRIEKAYAAPQQQRWPAALPMPMFQNPTPLVLSATPGQVARLKQTYPAATVTAWRPPSGAALPSMVVPLGVFDRPAEKLQGWLQVDLLGHQGPLYGGPLIVRGDAASGKTTTLQTLLLYLLNAYSPDQLRLYIIDANKSLVDFADEKTPHLCDRLDPTRLNYLDATDLDAVAAMRERFDRDIAVAPTQRPMLLLVADDFDEAMARPVVYPQTNNVVDLLAAAVQNRQRNVYLACAATRPSSMGAGGVVLNGMMTRIVLYMNGPQEQRTVLGARLLYGPTGPIPGRGFVQTRTTLDEAQIAAPVPGANDAERIVNLQAAIRELSARYGRPAER